MYINYVVISELITFYQARTICFVESFMNLEKKIIENNYINREEITKSKSPKYLIVRDASQVDSEALYFGKASCERGVNASSFIQMQKRRFSFEIYTRRSTSTAKVRAASTLARKR